MGAAAICRSIAAMSGQTWQHLMAVIATVLAAIATGLQARRALEKADHEWLVTSLSADGEHRSKKYTKRVQLSDLWKKKDPMDPEFNVKHFQHVALLWGLIMISSLIAVVAEITDWATSPV
jgi:hypothetical protein